MLAGVIAAREQTLGTLEETAATRQDVAHRTRLRLAIYNNQLALWIARYSAGEHVDALKQHFPDVVAACEAYHAQSKAESMDFKFLANNIEGLWLVSIAILLEVDDTLFQRLVTAINQPRKDWLYDRLVRTRLPTLLVHGQPAHPKVYGELQKAVRAEGAARDALIQGFLDGYYKRVKGCYFVGQPPETSFGLWLFELAALVKTSKLDDRSFATNPHYPADLVAIA